MQEVISILLFIVLAGTKLLFAPGAMLAAGYGVLATSIITYVGSFLGATTFYIFGVAIFAWWDRITGKTKEKKKLFSVKSRTLVKVKVRYGIIGLALLAPIISVPISAFIVAKIFPGNYKVLGIYAIVLAPISVGLSFLSKPVIHPIVVFVKEIFHLS